VAIPVVQSVSTPALACETSARKATSAQGRARRNILKKVVGEVGLLIFSFFFLRLWVKEGFLREGK
jgi:hypothetical protein